MIEAIEAFDWAGAAQIAKWKMKIDKSPVESLWRLSAVFRLFLPLAFDVELAILVELVAASRALILRTARCELQQSMEPPHRASN